jgi:uncharacterized protein (UPF0332 family)
MLRDRIIEKFYVDSFQVEKKLSLAKRDIGVAKKNFEDKSYDWTLAIAYNSMLQAGNALMFSEGYRPLGMYKHTGIIRFLRERFGKELTDKLIYFMDKARKKRHRIVYDEEHLVSEEEALNAIKFAAEFLKAAERIVSEKK